MEKAAAEDKARRNAIQDASRKRPSSAPAEDPVDVKRQKLEHESAATATANAVASFSPAAAASFLATVDFTKLPISLITDLVVANLQAFTEPELAELVHNYRQSQAPAQPSPPQTSQPTAARVPTPSRPPEPEPESSSAVRVKEEPVDPLQMDIDEEEFEYEPDKLNQEVCMHNRLMRLCGNPYFIVVG
jgi:symplekin